MRKILLFIIAFPLLSLSMAAQDKRVYTTHDPAFDYISEYMPEYYYENYEMDREPQNFAYPRLSVYVRVLRNFQDDKTFTYLLVCHGEDHATLFTEEIPSLISYLERVIHLMRLEKKEKKKDINHYIYNSLTGLFFKSERKQSSAGWPIFDLELWFPKFEKVKFSKEDEIKHLIYKLKSAEQYFPPKETDFRINEDTEQNDKWEMKEIQEPIQELKTI